MELEDLSAHYNDEHMIHFVDDFVDELHVWQARALEFANKDDDIPQESHSSSEISPSDYELFYGEISKEKSQSESSSDSSSSKK